MREMVMFSDKVEIYEIRLLPEHTDLFAMQKQNVVQGSSSLLQNCQEIIQNFQKQLTCKQLNYTCPALRAAVNVAKIWLVEAENNK